MEAGPASSGPSFPLFPPHLLSIAILASKVDHATHARLLDLSSDRVSGPEAFDDAIQVKWTAIAVGPGPEISFTGNAQIWETLQYGGLSLRSKVGQPTTQELMKSCRRWSEILEVLWQNTRSNAALQLRVQSWDVLLAIGPVRDVRRYDLLWLAFPAYRANYEFSTDRSGFVAARQITDKLIELAQTQREQIEASASRGRLFGVRMDDPLPSSRSNDAVRESVVSLKRATSLIMSLAEKQRSDADILVALSFALEKKI